MQQATYRIWPVSYTHLQRGNIVDSNGTVLATSVAVYNVVLDCSVMTSKKEYITPTVSYTHLDVYKRQVDDIPNTSLEWLQ